MPSPKPIIIVIGGQWGSEAKGAVAAWLCRERKVEFACRTGAVNAGHTVYRDGSDFAYKMQQLPTGWVADSNLVIGPGALVHPAILEAELKLLYGFKGKVYIDERAGLHTEAHTERSTASGRHHSMGATGKGCSEALIDRIRMRGSGGKLYRDYDGAHTDLLCDTERLINDAYDSGAQILLEGTQGSLLDLYLGPYPYVTHKPTQAATWIQEMGLSPRLHYEIVMVMRTFPIRVAGNSGPMPRETSWENLAVSINARLANFGKPPLVQPLALSDWKRAYAEALGKRGVSPRMTIEEYTQERREQFPELVSEIHREAFDLLPSTVQRELCKLFEFTTVTKKLRRVAQFDVKLARDAIRWNRPDYIVLTFINYLFPEVANTTSWEQWPAQSIVNCMHHVSTLQGQLRTPILYVTTGPRSEHILKVSEAL